MKLWFRNISKLESGVLSFWARGLQLYYDTGLYMLPTPTTAKSARRKPPKFGLCFSEDAFIGNGNALHFRPHAG